MRKKVQKPQFFYMISAILFLTALLALSGCDFLPTEATITPTLTATQTETPTPTIDWFPATPTSTMQTLPSPTPQPTLADLREGVTQRLIDDNFTDERLWETQQSSFGNVAFGIENLTLAVASPETGLTSFSQHVLGEDFYLELTIQASLCQPDDQVGVLFWRQSDSDYYRILIDCAGQVRLDLIQDGQTIVVNDWESGVRVQPGAPAINRLGVWVSRGQFQLYINDTFQFERRVADNRSGGLGVFARTISGSAMTVRFSDLQVYQVEID